MIYATSSDRFKKATVPPQEPAFSPPSKGAVHSQEVAPNGAFTMHYGGPDAGDGRSPAITCVGAQSDSFHNQAKSAMSMVTLFEERGNRRPYVHKDLIKTELWMTTHAVNEAVDVPEGVTPFFFIFWKGHLNLSERALVHEKTRDIVGWCTAKLGIGTFKVRGKPVALRELEICHFQIDPSQVGKGYGRACMAALETRRLGHTRLVAECSRDVVGFYEKCGWVRAKEDMGQCDPAMADAFNMVWVTLDLTVQTTNASTFSNAD